MKLQMMFGGKIENEKWGFMKNTTILVNIFLLTSSVILLGGCVQPVMSCAGIKTSYPRCAKFCTHDAVETCESQCKQLLGQACNL